MFRTLIVVLMALSMSPQTFAAAQIRASSDREMDDLLAGCWTQQSTFFDKRIERLGGFQTHEICFLPKGRVTMWSFGGDKYNAEGFEAAGRFKVTSGRLLLSGEPQDGWLFAAQALTCDILMVPGREMKLHNCAAQNSAQREPDSSFSRKAP